MANPIRRLRHWLSRMTKSWRPGPEQRAEAERVERIESRAERLGARRRDVLDMRVEVIQRGRDGKQQQQQL